MKVLILNHREVRDLYPMRECIAVMERVFRSLAEGRVIQPLRMAMDLPGGNVLAMMPSRDGDTDSVGAKVITVFPGNHGSAYDAHQGVVLLYDSSRGYLKAMMDGTAITGIRTAAVSTVATRALANPDSRGLAILGAGTQARAHLEAMRILFDLERVRVWSVFPEEARRLAEEESARTGLDIRATGSAEEAVEGQDIICTTTSTREPILMGRWIRPGAHINAIGACNPSVRELDTEAVLRSGLYVDRMESALREAGDFIIAKKEGAIDDSHIRGELGEVLTGRIRGRERRDEITLFKAVGLAMQDLASACYIYDAAKSAGTGVEVEMDGRDSVRGE